MLSQQQLILVMFNRNLCSLVKNELSQIIGNLEHITLTYLWIAFPPRGREPQQLRIGIPSYIYMKIRKFSFLL